MSIVQHLKKKLSLTVGMLATKYFGFLQRLNNAPKLSYERWESGNKDNKFAWVE